MAQSKYIFNRNVSHGVEKVHTHYQKGHDCPDHLADEMKKLGYVSLSEKPAEAKQEPVKSERKDAEKKDSKK